MIYTIFAVLFLAVLVWFTFRSGKIPPKTVFLGNLVMFLTGVVLYPAVFGYLYFRLSAAGMDSDYVDWAWNALKVFLELSGYPLVIFLFLTCFSALSARWDKKFRSRNARITRYCCSLCCSAAMLLIAPFCSLMAANEQVALNICILILGFANALILRCMFLLEKRDTEQATKAK
ncbi:MAG: hypothetical protein IJ325_13210 [Clostridia bacterium]|nr:hypothetical protein [Clostridia bacterium]